MRARKPVDDRHHTDDIERRLLRYILKFFEFWKRCPRKSCRYMHPRRALNGGGKSVRAMRIVRVTGRVCCLASPSLRRLRFGRPQAVMWGIPGARGLAGNSESACSQPGERHFNYFTGPTAV